MKPEVDINSTMVGQAGFVGLQCREQMYNLPYGILHRLGMRRIYAGGNFNNDVLPGNGVEYGKRVLIRDE